MIKIKAKIRLYKDGRKTPFLSGYRPLFDFVKESKISGHIELIQQVDFSPGEEGEVNITFLDKKFLGDNFGIGTKFVFSEGGKSLGEGEVKEIFLI